MPTIVYLVHGVGAGSSDGSPRTGDKLWYAPVLKAMEWIAATYGLSKPTVLESIPTTPPAGSDKPDAVWVVPVSYYSVFDEFRKSANDRAKAVKNLGIANLVDGQITQLTSTEFAWVNCLDVLLWWADNTQARPMATNSILGTITRADDLAHKVPGATIRRVLISHSLGTAATTFALRHLGVDPAWPGIGGFDYWATLANVAPFLMPTSEVYAPPLLPGRSGTLVRWMSNVHHEADPIPWLLPWRPWNISNAGPEWGDAWKAQQALGTLSVFETQGVAAPDGFTPDATDVHGYSNYLMSAQVSRELAGVIRGAAFFDSEIQQLNPAAKWAKLKQLTCTKSGSVLKDLKEARDKYIGEMPPASDPLNNTAGWLQRLLRAADLIMAAKDKC